MDGPLRLVFDSLNDFASGVKNIEEGKSMILQKDADSTSLEGETEAINEAYSLLQHLRAFDVTINDMLAKKTVQRDQNLQNLTKDVVVAYIRNCVEHHIKFVPEQFFQVGEHNIRHKIHRVMDLGNRIVAENPDNVDSFRRRCAGLIYYFTYPGAQLSDLERRMLSHWFRQWDSDNDVKNWDRFMVKLMIIAHSICTCLRRDGYTATTRTWINERIQDFIQLFSSSPYDDLFKNADYWRYVNFQKDLDPLVTTLNIPVVTAAVVDIDDMEMRLEALEAFIPLPSNGFMGACPAPVPRLDNLAYSRVTIDPNEKRDFVCKYTGITDNFEQLS